MKPKKKPALCIQCGKEPAAPEGKGRCEDCAYFYRRRWLDTQPGDPRGGPKGGG